MHTLGFIGVELILDSLYDKRASEEPSKRKMLQQLLCAAVGDIWTRCAWGNISIYSWTACSVCSEQNTWHQKVLDPNWLVFVTAHGFHRNKKILPYEEKEPKCMMLPPVCLNLGVMFCWWFVMFDDNNYWNYGPTVLVWWFKTITHFHRIFR